MQLTTRHHATQLFTSFDRTGTEPPAVVVESYQRGRRIHEKATELGAPVGTLAAAVAAALAAEKDPATDPEVQRIVTAGGISGSGTVQQIQAQAFDQFRDVCDQHADELVRIWRQPFDNAAAQLAKAHGALGQVELDDTETVVRKGGKAATAWASAQQGLATVEAVVSGWNALAELTRPGMTGSYRAVRMLDLTYDQWVELDFGHQKVTPWRAVLAGLTLSLPTLTEYRQRVRAIEQESQRRAAARADREMAAASGRRQREGVGG